METISNIDSASILDREKLQKDSEEAFKIVKKQNEEYIKLADKVIEQHPLFAKIIADKVNGLSKFFPFQSESIVPQKASSTEKLSGLGLTMPYPIFVSHAYGV